ncbi:Rib/alpha-like domain-containing protein, partial [Streptococcus oralis]|uniref:Rib/alpha-like domain-containing protein n=1 Tax=Streptococcus oralis TaxID=1303 RepID=UPI00240D4843
FPEGATFEYKTPVDTTTAGQQEVSVVVKDKDGKELVEIPTSVMVVEGYPQYVPVGTEVKAEDSIDPESFPAGTTFEYKSPVDTSKAGDINVTVLAKLDGQTFLEIPATIVVV